MIAGEICYDIVILMLTVLNGIFLIPWRVGRIGPLVKGSEKCTNMLSLQWCVLLDIEMIFFVHFGVNKHLNSIQDKVATSDLQLFMNYSRQTYHRGNKNTPESCK